MHLERGQATVEHIGLVLAVALLAGGLAGALAHGTAQGLARSLGGALRAALSALTLRGEGEAVATAAEVAYFGWAVDGTVGADQRPTLRDVRLRLEHRLGEVRGDEAFMRLAEEHAAALLPESSRPTAYRAHGGVIIDPKTWFAAPAEGQRPEVETPLSALQVRSVTAAEAASWLDQRLHPRASRASVAASLFELGGEVAGLGIVKRAASVIDQVLLASEVVDELSGSGGLPPGRREGDLVACWTVLRRPSGSDAQPLPAERQSVHDEARTFWNVAVIRDSTVIKRSAIPAPLPNGGAPSCND